MVHAVSSANHPSFWPMRSCCHSHPSEFSCKNQFRCRFRPPATVKVRCHRRGQARGSGEHGRLMCRADTRDPLAEKLKEASPSAFEKLVQGKRFLCTQCGKCCTGEGDVWVSDTDCARIAQHLDMPVSEFMKSYTRPQRRRIGWYNLKNRQETQDCIFLEGKLCSIHACRPTSCSTYPWWPDLMTKAGWREEAENVCEGIDHADAPEVDMVQAGQQLKVACLQWADRSMAMQSKKVLTKTPPP